MTPETVTALSSLALLLGLGMVSMIVSRLLRIPDIVLFVAAGLVAGPEVLGWIHLPAESVFGQILVTGGAVFMLYEGGRSIELGIFKEIWLGTTLLSTVGVLVTAGGVAALAHFVAGVPWAVADLTGAAVACTDPATIVPLFQQIRVRARLQQLVVVESAMNDATGAVLTLTLLSVLMGAHVQGGSVAWTFARLLLVGGAVGVGIGLLTQMLVAEGKRFALWGQREENAAASLLAMMAAYVLALSLGGSGFMAVFVAGAVRGNAASLDLLVHEGHQADHDTFLSLLGTVIRILIFGLLGANVGLPLIASLGLPGLAVIGALIFVVRPIAVLLSLAPDRAAKWSWREILFACWVRETGVVPAALASLLLAAKAPGANTVAAFIFLAVIGTIAIQTPTTAAWVKRLGVGTDPSP